MANLAAKNLQQAGTNVWSPDGGGGNGPTGKTFRAGVFVDGERYRTLSRRRTYYDCIAHGMPVVLADGGELPIEQVVPGEAVQAVGGWSHVASADVTEAVRTKRERPLAIALHSGRVLRVSDTHPMLCALDAAIGWARAGRIKPGDYVATPRRLAAGSGDEWSEHEAKLLGYLVGDGSCGRGYFGFTQKISSEVCAEFEQLAGGLGWEVVRSPSARWQMRVKGNGALRFVERSGLAHVRSRRKSVPGGVFRLPAERIAAFLGALWDCDGSVNEHIALATLATTSRALAGQVQSLLLRLGVWSFVRRREQTEVAFGDGILWIVEVCGKDLRRFAEVVPLAHKEKSRRLRAWSTSFAGRSNTDVVPAAWQGMLLRLRQRKDAGAYGNISREKLARLAEQDRNDALYELATSDVRWDRVKSVEREAEDEWMYDLSVPGCESFVAGGAYVHNCTQHDYKRVDFDGRLIQAGSNIGFTNPGLTSEKVGWYAPLRSRRPSAPYRLGRAIVNAFTNFVFGEGRFPVVRVRGDDDSQDFLQTCSRIGQLPLRMLRARNIGGSCGTVGLSWAFSKGKPTFSVHRGEDLFVHEWEDREAYIPAHVTKCFQYPVEEYDYEKQAVVKNMYWYRRDWTLNGDFVFKPARVDQNKQGEPNWEPDMEKSVIHNDRDSHFVWIQNLPADGEDGLPDYDGLYESLDEIDCVLSVIVRGAKLNLDPTLVLKEDKLFLNKMGVKKGSDNALVVDKDGDAKYLELAGSSIEAGIKLFNEHRRTILEVSECVIPDPDTIAAQGQSAAAQKMVFSRMMSKGGMLQEQYGTGLQRCLEPMLFISQARVQVPVTVINPDTQEPEEADQSFDLPPRVEQVPVLGDDGLPTGETTPKPSDRHPGGGADVELEWPPRFPPTPMDQQQMVTTLTTATGGKAIMSQQTATEIAMAAFGREGSDEFSKVQQDQKDDEAKQQQMTPGTGGPVDQPGMPKAKPPGGGGGAKPPGGGKSGPAEDNGNGGRNPAEPP